MRKLTALVLTFTLFGLFGCSPRPEPLSVEEGQRRLEAALADIPGVATAEGIRYSMQGPFNPDTAWMSGTLRSSTDDDEVNREILLEAGRRIVEAMHDNFPRRSWVRVEVIRADGTTLRYGDIGVGGSPTLDDLAEHLGVPRSR